MTTTTEPIVGNLAWVENTQVTKAKDGSDYLSTYINGEYLIVRVTPRTVTAVKLAVGYGGHSMKTFDRRHTAFEDLGRDDDFVNDWLEQQSDWALKPQRGEKLNWVESVYSEAAECVRYVRRALGRPPLDSATIEIPSTGTVRLRITAEPA